jgi:membrane protease YdiL (CAAX protease family)
MSPSANSDLFGRLRSLGFFLIAGVYYLVAETVASSAAHGLASGDWVELVYRVSLLFLLLVGFAAMGYAFQHQQHPLKAMGLVFRATALDEFGRGTALAWGMMIACVLPVALTGGLRITFWTTPRQFGLLFLDILILAVAALLEEVAFRGYPFQRLIEAVGPVIATLLLSALFALRHLRNPDATQASVMVTVIAGWLFSVAYLRTRALWLGWGFHFSWNVTMGILFGLPISGIRSFSPVIESNAFGPYWLTGGGYGPEGSLICALVLLAGIIVLFGVTREFAYQYAQPVIIPGGIPVDIDAAARQQHEAAMASVAEEATPAAPKLVQIAPALTVPEPPPVTTNGSRSREGSGPAEGEGEPVQGHDQEG